MLLVHHTRKGGGRGPAAHRGSGQIPATPDVNIELNVEAGGIRVLTAQGRYDDTPPRLAYRREGNRLCVIEGKAEAGKAKAGKATAAAIRAVLPTQPLGLTVNEVASLLKLASSTVRQALRTGAEAGKWAVTGSGRKNDPSRYSRNR